LFSDRSRQNRESKKVNAPLENLPDRSQLLTERRLAESMNLDRMPIEEAIELMNAQDAISVAAVAAQRVQIAAAVERVASALSRGGRLFYVGAGTSGRLGVLDAAECPPTFRTDANQIQGIIAGGDAAMFKSQEGAEDRPEDGAAAIDAGQIGDKDIVLGIAAGGTTPFVAGALKRAGERGAGTIFLCCVERSDSEPPADLVIRPLTGPEILTGSTRLKAGTATKIVLNQITTLAMVQLGKVYENLMVDLRATNAKLWDRGARIVATITGLDRETAMQKLRDAGGEVKTAIVMDRQKIPADKAREMLEKNGGNLRAAIYSNSTSGSSSGTNG
jgi:N-acetylmuramic acid 6-phosphate etherase